MINLRKWSQFYQESLPARPLALDGYKTTVLELGSVV